MGPEPSLQALLRELAAFNRGLCLITTRIPVSDLADFERTAAQRRELEQLSGEAGAELLRAAGVKGDEEKLRGASQEFSGHCLALTLLGSYLSDAYHGDIRFMQEVSARLGHDVRQGAHARKVMESYQSWFGEGPELSVLRMLGLFDRPADEKAMAALLEPPVICGLTESLTNLDQTEWRTIVAKLRRARLVAGEDPLDPGHLDTHPRVREYFAEDQLFVLMQAGLHLTIMRSPAIPEVKLCYERGVLGAIHQLFPVSVICTRRSVAPFPHDGQVDGNLTDCQAPLRPGAAAE